MRLDIRLPIGLLFASLGILLTIYGLATDSDAAMYQRSLGININLWCGLIFFGFGVVMLFLGWRGKKENNQAPKPSEAAGMRGR